MDLYNNKLARRLNRFLRPRFVAPGKRRRLHAAPFSLLCNNCTGGMILHDLGLPFNSPTVNLFFTVWTFLSLSSILTTISISR